MMVRIELGTKRISPHEITLPWSFLVCPPVPLLADMDFGAPWPTPDPFLSDCEVIRMSLSIGNLSQSSIEGHGKPWFSMVDRHPDLTFWHSDLGHRRKQVWPQAHLASKLKFKKCCIFYQSPGGRSCVSVGSCSCSCLGRFLLFWSFFLVFGVYFYIIVPFLPFFKFSNS